VDFLFAIGAPMLMASSTIKAGRSRLKEFSESRPTTKKPPMTLLNISNFDQLPGSKRMFVNGKQRREDGV
jgi:hypothetical protein